MPFRELRARLDKSTATLRDLDGVPNVAYDLPHELRLHGSVCALMNGTLTSEFVRKTHAEDGFRKALADRSRSTMSTLKSLVDPEFNEDDVTILPGDR